MKFHHRTFRQRIAHCVAVTLVLACTAAVAQSNRTIEHPLPDVAGEMPSDEPPLGYALPPDAQLPIPLYFKVAAEPRTEPRHLPTLEEGDMTSMIASKQQAGGVVAPADFQQPLSTGRLSLLNSSTRTANRSQRRPLVTVTSALAMVVGLFLGFVWLSRKTGRVTAGRVPSDVMQTLGRFPLGHRQELQVVRFGSKVLALAVSANKTETLGELSDPDEVHQITRLCLSNPPSTPENIQDVLYRLSLEPGHPLANEVNHQTR